jgi:hypothetical protein
MAQKELVTLLLCTDKLFSVSNQLNFALVLESGWESVKKMSKYNDFDWVFSYDHLLKSADLCKRNVYWKASVQNFMFEKDFNVSVIHNELMENRFRVKHKHKFSLYERGKKRIIQSVHIRERVVQRCLCDYCLTPLLEPTLCYDNCASQKDKGISFAINRVQRHLQKYYRKHGNKGYVLLFDYSNYFGSINHEMIMNKLKKYVTDERILNIIQIFINEFDEGLGLGSQVSQVLSLFAASSVDHMIKDEMRFKYYIRYMDDGLIIHNDKKELEELLKKIIQLSNDLGLTINTKKTHITSIKNFKFLKKRFSLLDNGKIIIRLSADSITRMRRKLKKYEGLYRAGKMSLENIETSYKSWRGFALQYNSYNTVKRLDKYYNELIKKILRKGGGSNE